MPELPQPLLLVLALALVAAGVVLGRSLSAPRGGRREPQEEARPARRPPEQPPAPDGVLPWVASDFLRFMRRIHGPLKVREIPVVLEEFIASTFDPAAGVILLRRRPALSDPGREDRLVVVSAPGTRIARGSTIALGEGDLGYVAEKRRAMDRRELDQTPSATGDTGAMEGFVPELAAPLAVGGKTLGVVGITAPRRMRPRAKQLLDLIAQTTALALESSLVLHRIRTAASADPLTGVYNKGAVLHGLDELIAAARDADREVAILLFDVDDLKSYNDSNGRKAGDELLRLLTSLVSDEVRTDDVLGRLGGAEFLLVLPDRSAAEADKTAQKLLQLVREHRFAGAGSQPLGKITISGGVAVFPRHGQDRSALLQAADRALRRARERGRDRVLVASVLEDADAEPASAVAEPAERVDDLQQISGIGPVFAGALHEIGISTYRDIAELNWTRMVLVASRLNTFPERIVSDRWLQQARELHRRKYGEEL